MSVFRFSQFYDNITLLEQPVRKFFRAGCFLFHSQFPLQGFFFEGFKSNQHFFQTVSGKARSFLCLIDFLSPVLALVFVKQIIIVFSGSFIKLTLVLKELLFAALITAQLISLVFGKKYFPADFAFPEIQPPIVQAVQIIDYQRIQGRISSNTLHFPFAVWIPEVKPGIFLWQRTMNMRENIQSFGLPCILVKVKGWIAHK